MYLLTLFYEKNSMSALVTERKGRSDTILNFELKKETKLKISVQTLNNKFGKINDFFLCNGREAVKRP